MIRPTLNDFNPDEILHYPFIFNVNGLNGSWFTVEDSTGRICVHNKMEHVKLKVFIIIKPINKATTLAKHISCKYTCEFNNR